MLEVAVFDNGPNGTRLLGRTTDAAVVKRVRDEIAAREQRKLDQLREGEARDPSAEPPSSAEPQ
jgi:hypothetical protein